MLTSAAHSALCSLTLLRRIPKEALSRNENCVWIRGLYGLNRMAAHELCFADSPISGNNVARVFDGLTARLHSSDVYRPEKRDEEVHDVAYSAESDTLFVCTMESAESCFSVRSFARTNGNGKWTFCHKMQLPLESSAVSGCACVF